MWCVIESLCKTTSSPLLPSVFLTHVCLLQWVALLPSISLSLLTHVCLLQWVALQGCTFDKYGAVPLDDGNALGPQKAWRCYDHECLTDNNTKYKQGSGCTDYCSRDKQISLILETCKLPPLPPPPPPPPALPSNTVEVFVPGELGAYPHIGQHAPLSMIDDTAPPRNTNAYVTFPPSLPPLISLFVPHPTPPKGYPCIRIPSIALAGDNQTLNAFAECRNSTGDGCYPTTLPPHAIINNNRDICQKRSTDGGKTWSGLKVIANSGVRSSFLDSLFLIDAIGCRAFSPFSSG
jgi:hypothetical protein